jgi:hypothetical protein
MFTVVAIAMTETGNGRRKTLAQLATCPIEYDSSSVKRGVDATLLEHDVTVSLPRDSVLTEASHEGAQF